MNLRVVEHRCAVPAEWNALVKTSTTGWAYHLHEAIGIAWREGENLSFGIRDDDAKRYVLVAQLHIAEREEWGERFRVLWSQWGFCWANGLEKKELQLVTEAFKAHIDGLYKRWDIRGFEAALPPLAKQWAPECKETVNPLMTFGFAPGVRYTYVVDLEKEDGHILGDCQQTTRNEIRRIERTGKYRVVRAPSGEAGFREWWALHTETFGRTGGTPVSEAYARNLVLTLVPMGVCDIWNLVDDSSMVVANVTVMKHGGTAYYLWGSSVTGRVLGANKWLLYKAIMAFKHETEGMELGHRWFETGGAAPHLRGGKYKGLSEYKKSFGTILTPVWRGWYEAPADRLVMRPTIWERIKWKGKVWGKRLLRRN